MAAKRYWPKGRKYPFHSSAYRGNTTSKVEGASRISDKRPSEDYDDFAVKLDGTHPRYEETLQLPF